MKTLTTLIVAGGMMAASIGTASAHTPLPEERMARAEVSQILSQPIAGVANDRWFDYRSNIGEAKKELQSDLKRATDLEDRRDAWEEYATELADEREDYVKEMAERGYRDGRVTIGG